MLERCWRPIFYSGRVCGIDGSTDLGIGCGISGPLGGRGGSSPIGGLGGSIVASRTLPRPCV